MKREYSLSSKKIIDEVFGKRDSKGTQEFTILKRRSNEEHFHFLISIGRKFGNSVKRNLMKRRIRSIIDEVSDQIDLYDFVIIVKPASRGLSYLKIKTEIILLLKKSNIIKGA
jgi:ribonuclease P protein component